jgi:dethiobiotin synthetase
MTHRPRLLIGVAGTHTEVGKTYVSARWLSYLRAVGFAVAARKPVQSFAVGDASNDAVQLAQATGEDQYAVCPVHRRYPLALAPPMAADLLHRQRILKDELLQELTWPADIDVGLVETVGGPYSPLSHDGASVDLLRLCQPDRTVLIADAGLGTLNAVRLCWPHLPQPVVFLNRYDANNELHRLNYQWLSERYSIPAAVDLEQLTQMVNVGSRQ